LITGARFLHESSTEPAFELADMGRYPGLVAGGAVSVHGELYEIPEDRLPALDTYEGPEYARVTIRLCDGTEAHAWVMHARHAEGRPRIAGGSFRTRG
jgi:gamma-glutamylcyclotransferase (GGCT)/AIG2-like uncharacterized protein YtfP